MPTCEPVTSGSSVQLYHRRRRVAYSCQALSLSLLVGSIASGCGESAGKSAGPIDGAIDQASIGSAEEVGVDSASLDVVLPGGADLKDLSQDNWSTWLDVGGEAATWAEVGIDLRTVDTVGDQEAGPASLDSAPDGIAAIACDQLTSAYSAFLATHRDCASVSDCKVVGGAGTCNCMEMIGNGSGDAISMSATSDASAYLGRARACSQQGFRFLAVCDAGPARNLRCESGKCVADQSSCLVFGG